MIKVKMVSRHTAESGEKLERGLSYLLPLMHAQELIKHGLAELVTEPKEVAPEVEVKVEQKKPTSFKQKGQKAKLGK